MPANELRFEIVVDDPGTATIQKFGQAAQDVNKKMKEGWEKTAVDVKKGWLKLWEDIGKKLQDKLVDMIAAGKSFVDVFKGLFNTFKSTVINNFLSSLKTGFTNMLQWIKTNWIAALVAGVAMAVAAIVKLFRKPEWKKISEETTRDLGVKISESLAKKIEKTAKKIGDRYAAISVHLADIIKEVGLTTKNFETFGRRAHDILSHFQTGLIDADTATKSLNDAFSELAKGAEDMGITFSRSMIDIIRHSRELGLEIKSVTEYIDKKLSSAISGLSKMIAGMSESQEEFNRVARVSLATYNEIIASTKDYLAAVEQLKPRLDELAKKQEEWGLEGNEAFNKLKRFSELVTQNKALIESVQGMTDTYSALGSIGALTQDLFSDWQNQALTKYDQLIAAGFSQDEALRMLVPTLNALAEASETFGFKLSDSMKTLYDTADAQKLLKKENPFDRMNESLDRMVEILERIARKWGVAIDRVEEYGETLSGLETGGWEQETGWAGRGRTMQFGTPYVPATGLYKLHQGEAVIPAVENKRRMERPQVIHLQVPIYLGGTLLETRLLKIISDGSKDGRLKVFPSAVREF